MRSAVFVLGILLLAGCATNRAPVEERRASRPAPRPAAQASAAAPVAAAPVAAPVAAAEGYYIVRKGDTLYSIALDNGADYRDLAQWNGLDDPARIQVGQALRVKAPDNRTVQSGAAQTGSVQIGRPTIIGRIESRPLEGRSGPVETPKLDPKPAAVPAKPSSFPAPNSAAPAPTAVTEFIWPVKGKVIAGFAEPRSKGIDIGGKLGDPVLAAAPGRVTYIGNGIPGLGKLVVIKHDNGFITVYAHNRDILVKEQQAVAQGQKIAELGASDSDRPKLHFQIRKGAAAVDPLRYLPAL
jgi:lipoprotein NlpD